MRCLSAKDETEEECVETLKISFIAPIVDINSSRMDEAPEASDLSRPLISAYHENQVFCDCHSLPDRITSYAKLFDFVYER